MLTTNTLRLPTRSILLLGFIVLGFLVLPAHLAWAQVSTPEAAGDAIYRDKAGRFQVPIPTNWIAEEHDGYVSIVTNDRKIAISVVVIAGESATAAIEDAMELIGSTAGATPVAPPMATPSSAGDDVALFTYDDGLESGQLIQAYAQRVGDSVFVLVLHGEREVIGLRQVQVDKVLFGVQVFPEALGRPDATPVS